MNEKKSKPAWWIPYLLLVLMIGALIAESQDGLPSWANEIGGIGILLIFFACVGIWLRVNASALWEEELDKTKGEIYRVREYDPKPWPPEEDTHDRNEPSFILGLVPDREDPGKSI